MGDCPALSAYTHTRARPAMGVACRENGGGTPHIHPLEAPGHKIT